MFFFSFSNDHVDVFKDYDNINEYFSEKKIDKPTFCGEFDKDGQKEPPCIVGRYCGPNVPGRIVSEKKEEEDKISKLFLIFETNAFIEKAGFKFYYRQIGKCFL